MPRPSTRLRLQWAACCAGGLALLAWDVSQRPAAPGPSVLARWPVTIPGPAPQATALRPAATGTIPMPAKTPAAHASTLLAMPADHPAALTAFWFAGTRESAPDVQIAASQFDRGQQRWSEAQIVVTREWLGEQLGFGVRRLGNPVAWLDASGRMHLWVVATGAGGWAASRIAHLRQTRPPAQATPRTQATQPDRRPEPGPLQFEVERVLPLSWMWNTSYLVRNAPLSTQDGGMLLPVHFELGIKYPVALRFDPKGNFKDMVRMSGRTHVLQPSLLALEAQHWLALMRNQSPQGHIAVAQTQDAGRSWQDRPDLGLSNPDAAVAALALGRQSLLLAHNTGGSRAQLTLSHSADGLQWHTLKVLAQGGPGAEFSYPALVWADGSLWVSYTEQRQRIAWQRFDMPSRAAQGSAGP